MLRILYFSASEGEYVVLTDEPDDPEDWLLPGYSLSGEFEVGMSDITPISGSFTMLPLGYELRRQD